MSRGLSVVVALSLLLAGSIPASLAEAPVSPVASTADDGPSLQLVGQIGGNATAVAARGSIVYLALGLRLAIIDASEPAHPALLGQTDLLGKAVRRIAVSGDYAYLMVNDGLWVVDVSDPTHPVPGIKVALPGDPKGMTISGDIMYVAAFDAGLRIFSLADPAHPVGIGALTGIGGISAVAVLGQYAYLADEPNNGLRIASVAEPTSPYLIAYQGTVNHPYDVALMGQLAFVATDSFIVVIDVRDPTHPSRVGIGGGSSYNARIFAVGGTVFTAQGGALTAYDASDPTPTQASRDVRTWAQSDPLDFCISAGMGYGAGTRGLQIVRMSDPSSLTEVGQLAWPSTAATLVLPTSAPYVGRAIGWLGAQPAGMYALDLSRLARPNLQSCFLQGFGPWSYHATDLVVSGHYAYMADASTLGFRILDVSDLDHPTPVSPELPRYSYWVDDIAISGGYAYTLNDTLGLRVADVSEPSMPTTVSTTTLAGRPRRLVLDGSTAFVASETAGVLAVSVITPTAPAVIGSLSTPGAARYLALREHRLYVSDASGRVSILDVADPSHPTLLGSHQLPSATAGPIAVSASTSTRPVLVYVGCSTTLHVLDVTDSAAPAPLTTYALPGNVQHVLASANTLYVSTQDWGLYILRLTGAPRPASQTLLPVHSR